MYSYGICVEQPDKMKNPPTYDFTGLTGTFYLFLQQKSGYRNAMFILTSHSCKIFLYFFFHICLHRKLLWGLCCFRFQKLWRDLRWNRTMIRMISCLLPQLFPCGFNDFRVFVGIDRRCCDNLTCIKHPFVCKITLSAGDSLPAVSSSSYRPGAYSTLGNRTNPADN